jgi:hypothetical protein
MVAGSRAKNIFANTLARGLGGPLFLWWVEEKCRKIVPCKTMFKIHRANRFHRNDYFDCCAPKWGWREEDLLKMSPPCQNLSKFLSTNVKVLWARIEFCFGHNSQFVQRGNNLKVYGRIKFAWYDTWHALYCRFLILLDICLLEN